MSKKNEVATVEEPKFPVGMSEFANAGMENMEAGDYAIPFIKIVQKASPVIDTNPDARPGMFLNSVSGELYRELILIPCGFKKEIVQWAARPLPGQKSLRQGIQGSHPWDTPLMQVCVPNDKGIPAFPAGHPFETDLMVETRYHYVYCISPETGEAFPALISMSSTQHKRSKRWVSLIGTRKMEVNGKRVSAPSFAFKYHATTEMESRDQNTWYSWVITTSDAVTEDWLMEECISFYKSILADTVKVSAEDGLDE
jgi:hypothetical protein